MSFTHYYYQKSIYLHLYFSKSYRFNSVSNTALRNTGFNTALFNNATPLMYACKFLKRDTVDFKQFDKQFDIIKLLIENGANIHIKDVGNTLLINIFAQSNCTHRQKIQLLDNCIILIGSGQNTRRKKFSYYFLRKGLMNI
jgi:hypothetical protein